MEDSSQRLEDQILLQSLTTWPMTKLPRNQSANLDGNQKQTNGVTRDNVAEARNQLYQEILLNELLPSAGPQTTPDKHTNLLRYSNITPSPRKINESPLKPFSNSRLSLSSQLALQSPKKLVRYISKTPYKVLDAPDLQDDFYLNLVDWSSGNQLGVGLGSSVYLWNGATNSVTNMCNLGPYDSVCSVNWMQRVFKLNVGNPPCCRNQSRFSPNLGHYKIKENTSVLGTQW
jgi:cell division cycle 20-like protein 1 (cofactor of APC complex)